MSNRGALISKLTDISITDILTIKHTDTDADTDKLLQCCIVAFQHLIYVCHIDCLHVLDTTLVGGPDITSLRYSFTRNVTNTVLFVIITYVL